MAKIGITPGQLRAIAHMMNLHPEIVFLQKNRVGNLICENSDGDYIGVIELGSGELVMFDDGWDYGDSGEDQGSLP
jgi:hypothetical protein